MSEPKATQMAGKDGKEPQELRQPKLRVFISYGHDEHRDLARRLNQDVKRRGHETWFDEDQLLPGESWPDYIERGLKWIAERKDIGRMLFLMTPHSTARPNGFCLREMTRALQYALTIVPVMAVEVEPPLEICRIQWVDMRDCIPLDKNIPTYENRFDRLRQALEEGKHDDRGVQSRLLRMLVSESGIDASIAFESDMARHLEKFSGREWVFTEIDRWLADPVASRVFWIQGGPGVGKTAIAAKIRTRYRQVAAFHFCQHGIETKRNPRRIVLSIAYQLSTQLPEFQARLENNLEKLEKIVEESRDAATLFDALIIEQLGANFPPPGRIVIVLIDALDEATEAGGNELAEFIATHFLKTPPWLRLVITSRPEVEVKAPLQDFNPFVLDASESRNIKDIKGFLREQLGSRVKSGQDLASIVDDIVSKSEGMFLYVRKVCEEVDLGRLSLDNVDALPQGLGGVYFEFFKRQFPVVKSFKEHVRPALAIIIAALEPIELQLVGAMQELDETAMSDFAYAVGSLFTRSLDKVKICRSLMHPFHKSLVDWLTTAEAGNYFTSKEAGIKALASSGLEAFKHDPANMPRYHLAHLSRHLAGLHSWVDLCTVLADLRYVHAKVQAGMLDETIDEYNAFLKPGIIEASPLRADVEGMARFLKAQAHVLRKEPQLFLQQAINQGESAGIEAAAEHLLRDNHSPVIRWLNKPHGRDPCIATLAGHVGGVSSCVFSADGSIIVSSSRDKTLKLWDTRTGKEKRTLIGHSSWIRTCAFSPVTNIFASGSLDNTLKLWDVNSEKELVTFLGHSDSVEACAFSPDGNLIVTGSGDKTLKLWHIKSGKEIRTLIGHSDSIEACAFSPFGNTIVSGSNDKTIKLWDVQSGTLLHTFIGHTNDVHACVFSPDGKLIGSASIDGTVRLWDLNTNRLQNTLTGHTGSVRACAFSPDGNNIISGSHDYTVKLWDVRSGAELRTYKGHSNAVRSCTFSPDGKTFISGSKDGTIKIWDLSISETFQPQSGHSKEINACAFSPDGTLIVSASDDKTLKLWDAFTGKELSTLTGHAGWVNTCAFFPDGSRIISGSWDKTLKIWDVQSGKEICNYAKNMQLVNDVSFSPDGLTMLTGLWNGSLIYWNVPTGKEIRTLTGHSKEINSCEFSPDGHLIVSGSSDSTLKIWDVQSGNELRSLKGHGNEVTSCAFSPDGTTIVSGSWDNTIKLWNTQSGKVICTLKGHSEAVEACKFLPNGSIIISVSRDRTVKLWDIQTEKMIVTFHAKGSLRSLAISKVGMIAVGDEGGNFYILKATLPFFHSTKVTM
jgi:WD40 repeat protein